MGNRKRVQHKDYPLLFELDNPLNTSVVSNLGHRACAAEPILLTLTKGDTAANDRHNIFTS